MKKNLLLVLSLLIAGGVFAQEYTIYLGGSVGGTITVQKERNGKITITPHMNTQGWVWIGKTICPVLPEDGFSVWKTTKSIVIDGDTTTVTDTDASRWRKIAIDGNTMTETDSSGRLVKTVLNGNTLTRTYPNDTMTLRHYTDGFKSYTDTVSEGWWQKIVVTGNTMTETDSLGLWSRAVINGNTTTVTKNGELAYEEVIRGNTRTLTYSYGSGYTEVVNGNTITITSFDGKNKEVVDKQGNDIFITITGYAFDAIGVSEKDRVKSVIDGITSGRIKDGLFYELIDYGR
ncbi:hypothetical protein FACS189491_12420 [Spirochaetia bacterium]|nr:hypothetical protein FACS189491_12420 [Spirochaetia bacterium]